MIAYLSHKSAIQFWLSPKAHRLLFGQDEIDRQASLPLVDLMGEGPARFRLKSITPETVCSLRASEAERLSREYGITAPLVVSVCDDAAKRRSKAFVSMKHPAHVPRAEYVFVEPGLWVVSPELALFQAACSLDTRKDMVEMLALCSLFFAMFVCDESESAGIARRRPVSSRGRCLAFLERCAFSRSEKASFMRKAVRFAVENAASPPEIVLGLLAGVPLHVGGYGMKGVECNHCVDTTKAFSDGRRRYRICDIYVSSCRLDLEYQGREHHETSLQEDARRQVELAAVGVEVIPVVREQLVRFESCERLMIRAVAKRGVRLESRLLRKYAETRKAFHWRVMRAVDGKRWTS